MNSHSFGLESFNGKKVIDDICSNVPGTGKRPIWLTPTIVAGRFLNFQKNNNKTWSKDFISTRQKVKELTASTPLGEKKSNVIYSIPCKCDKSIYMGETYTMFEARKKSIMQKSV